MSEAMNHDTPDVAGGTALRPPATVCYAACGAGTTVPGRIWQAAGTPPMEGQERGTCRTCGAPGVGVRFEDWVKPTFTDQDLLHPGEIACHACLFCTQERTQLMADLTGRDKPQRFRTYSHFVTGGGGGRPSWHILTKGDKERMRALLLDPAGPPDVALIAESGQKHIVFYARPGFWQFELATLTPDPARLAALLETTDDLYSRGAGKGDILSGRYSAGSIYRVGPALWRDLEARIAPHRGGPLFELAVFLTLKHEMADDPTEPEPAGEPAGQLALF